MQLGEGISGFKRRIKGPSAEVFLHPPLPTNAPDDELRDIFKIQAFVPEGRRLEVSRRG